jgi:hypothetical protein
MELERLLRKSYKGWGVNLKCKKWLKLKEVIIKKIINNAFLFKDIGKFKVRGKYNSHIDKKDMILKRNEWWWEWTGPVLRNLYTLTAH